MKKCLALTMFVLFALAMVAGCGEQVDEADHDTGAGEVEEIQDTTRMDSAAGEVQEAVEGAAEEAIDEAAEEAKEAVGGGH